MSESRFLRVVVVTWVIGIAIVLSLLALDYAGFAEMRETTLTTMADRIDAIDELFRAALEVDASLPLGEDTTVAQIDEYSKAVDEFGSRVSDYQLHGPATLHGDGSGSGYRNGNGGMPSGNARGGGASSGTGNYRGRNRGGKTGGVLSLTQSSFFSAGASLKDAEETLEKLIGRLPSLATQTESMVKNFDQARSYRAQARQYEMAARSLEGSWDWGAQSDLYSTAQVLRSMAMQYEINANRIISNVGSRRKEIRDDINGTRKRLADARANCDAAATRGYAAYLEYKAARFSLRRSLLGESGGGRMRGTGR